MNEQLIVKNFGPIKDAKVDFKRVTVFIGPTGGGKSTLAKLAAIFRDDNFFLRLSALERQLEFNKSLSLYGLSTFGNTNSEIYMDSTWNTSKLVGKKFILDKEKRKTFESNALVELQSLANQYGLIKPEPVVAFSRNFLRDLINTSSKIEARNDYFNLIGKYFPDQHYIPADRVLTSIITGSTFRLQSQRINTSSILTDFLGSFEMARDFYAEHGGYSLEIPSLELHYEYENDKQTVRFNTPRGAIKSSLSESASGIQSIMPLVLIADFFGELNSQSIIVEEPELNLYPTAQQGLLNWLVEKCTKGDNDLIITTHSPYILSSCNLLLEAYKVAQQRPDLEEEITAIVPKEQWLNPDEFAAYYVADGTVKPITDVRTHLIGSNELDAVSGDISDSFRKLLRLKKQVA